MDAWRVAVLGDGGVGKTALAVQFTLNKFIDWYDPTIEDTYRTKLLVDDRMCFVEVIDTAGQEEYSILRDQWAREGQGFILVYSILHRNSYNRLRTFHRSLLRTKQSPIFVLVGNMSDLAAQREVTPEDGWKMAREFGCTYMETSAKTSEGVKEVFVGVIRKLREGGGGPMSPTGGGSGVDGLPGKRKKKKGGGCIIS